jgi:hypothetical protein
MTYAEFMAAAQVLLEEKIGAPIRRAQRKEDAAFDRSAEALKRRQQAYLDGGG